MAGTQGSFPDWLLIDERSIGRAKILEDDGIAIDLDPAMSAGNGRVRDREVVIRAAAKEIGSWFQVDFPGFGGSGVDQKAVHAFRASLNPSVEFILESTRDVDKKRRTKRPDWTRPESPPQTPGSKVA